MFLTRGLDRGQQRVSNEEEAMSQINGTQVSRWHAMADVAALNAAVAVRVLAAAERAIRARGRFTVVLAGGNTPRGAYELLRGAPADWRAWHVFYGDERCTPRDDVLRNSRMAEVAWLAHVPILGAQVHEIPAELGPVEAAKRYATLLEPVGDFDLVLLGLGEDGHTGSLFPDHDWGRGADAPSALAVFDAPKPPPERVSLSAHRFSQAAEVLFMVAGAEKRDAVARWRAGDSIAARAIVPKAGVDVLIAP
jgi:6-phosphogluconolactonase